MTEKRCLKWVVWYTIFPRIISLGAYFEVIFEKEGAASSRWGGGGALIPRLKGEAFAKKDYHTTCFYD